MISIVKRLARPTVAFAHDLIMAALSLLVSFYLRVGSDLFGYPPEFLTGVSHAGTRPWPRHHGARSASRSGTLGLRPLGLPLAPELLGSAALLGLAPTLLGRRLGLSPPLVVIGFVLDDPCH